MNMARDAALGMTWLHESNPCILHRDLKPSNLLVSYLFVANKNIRRTLTNSINTDR